MTGSRVGKHPMISVCMATFNGEKYIYDQLTSILSQIGLSDEIVISDDSSQDRTIQIIKSIKDRRIRLLENKTFYSPTFNFENALKNASGDILFLSDQDDVWANGKVNTMARYLETYDMVVSDCWVINERNEKIFDSFYQLRRSGRGYLRNLCHNSYLGCCMAFHRHILNQALPFPKRLPTHDQWLGLVAEMFGRTHFCKHKLLYLRRHGENFSPTGEKSPFSIRKKFWFRAYFLGESLKRRWRAGHVRGVK